MLLHATSPGGCLPGLKRRRIIGRWLTHKEREKWSAIPGVRICVAVAKYRAWRSSVEVAEKYAEHITAAHVAALVSGSSTPDTGATHTRT